MSRARARYPGVTRMPDGRVQLRWTVMVAGRRVGRNKILPAETSMQDAAKRRAELLDGTRDELVQTRPAQETTLGEYARSWLAQRVKPRGEQPPDFKASTAINWRDQLAHILPAQIPLRPGRPDSEMVAFGELELGEVRREHVQAWVSWAESATYTPKWGAKRIKEHGPPPPSKYSRTSLSSWFTKLTQLLKDAAADAGLRDPTERVRGPRVQGRPRKRQQRTLSASEIQQLFMAVAPGWHAEVYMAAMTGMRAGELYALEWSDLDLPTRIGQIRRAHYRGVVGLPKSGEAREIPLSRGLVPILMTHRRIMIRSEHLGVASGLVFPASQRSKKVPLAAPLPLGWHRLPNSLKKVLEQASAKAGLDVRVTPQILRRSFNTNLVEADVERLVIRDIVGHVDEEMTERYHHARAPVRLRAVDNLETEIVYGDCVREDPPGSHKQKRP